MPLLKSSMFLSLSSPPMGLGVVGLGLEPGLAPGFESGLGLGRELGSLRLRGFRFCRGGDRGWDVEYSGL